MVRLISALIALELAGCGAGRPNTREGCISTYAKPAATKQLVRAAYASCATAFDETSHPVLQARALCMAVQIPDLKTESALGVVISECQEKWPTPTCTEEQEFSFERDYCVAICKLPNSLSDDGKVCEENPFSKFDAGPPAGFVLDETPPPPPGFTPVEEASGNPATGVTSN